MRQIQLVIPIAVATAYLCAEQARPRTRTTILAEVEDKPKTKVENAPPAQLFEEAINRANQIAKDDLVIVTDSGRRITSSLSGFFGNPMHPENYSAVWLLEYREKYEKGELSAEVEIDFSRMQVWSFTSKDGAVSITLNRVEAHVQSNDREWYPPAAKTTSADFERGYIWLTFPAGRKADADALFAALKDACSAARAPKQF